MHALYEARADGAAGAGEAMTRAEREILRERRASGLTTHPFYWAAFTANGE
jgi:CHAT domain-containing protein